MGSSWSLVSRCIVTGMYMILTCCSRSNQQVKWSNASGRQTTKRAASSLTCQMGNKCVVYAPASTTLEL